MRLEIKSYSDRLLKSQLASHEQLLKSCSDDQKEKLEKHIEAMKAELEKRKLR